MTMVESISQLYAAYCHAMDSSDARRLGACFTEDAVIEIVGAATIEGRAALEGIAERPRTMLHMTLNVLVEPSSDEAAAVQAHFVLFNSRTGERQALGRYFDEVVLDDGVWRWSKRRVLFTWAAGAYAGNYPVASSEAMAESALPVGAGLLP